MRRRLPATAAGLSVVLLGTLAGLTAWVQHAPLPLDLAALTWALEHRTPWLTALALAVTSTGSRVPTYALAAVAGAIGCRRRPWVGIAVAEATLVAGQGVRLLLATWRQRPGPPVADLSDAAARPAFPSGHATTSALVAVLLLAALRRRLRGRLRLTLQLLTLAWAVCVGLTRIYLGVHWVTDVLAGWLLVGGLSSLAAAVVLACRRRQESSRT